MADLFLGSTALTPGTPHPPVPNWFDDDDTTWQFVVGGATVGWDAGPPAAVLGVSSIRIKWSYGTLVPGSGAAGPFRIQGTNDNAFTTWTDVLIDPDPVGNAGASFPGDFELAYDLPDPVFYRYWRFTSTGISNNDIKTLAGFEAAIDPGAGSTPFVCALDDTDLSELVCIDAEDLVDWMIRKELQGTGSGYIVIHRSHVAADTDVIKKGNWIAVTIPQIDDDALFVFQIEQVETDLVSFDEGGGEIVKIAGRGELSYLERYKEHPRTYVIPDFDVDGVKHGPAGTGNKVGQLLNRLLAEGQHVNRGVVDFGLRLEPLQHLTHDFDYDDDSDGNTWNVTDMTAELSQGSVGDSGLHAIMEYIGTGEIDIVMWPTFLLQAFNSFGRDLSGGAFAADVVRFVKGENVAEQLKRSEGLTVDPTHTIVQGQGVYGFAETPSAQTSPHVEGYVSTFGTDAAALEAIGEADMARRLRQGESVQFRVKTPRLGQDPDPENGLYLPGPQGSNGNYWIGDTVTIHTGTGFRDYDDVAARVMAITIKTDEAGDLEVTVELKATTFTGRLTPFSSGVGAAGVSMSPSAGGTGGGSPAPPPTTAAINAHVFDPTDAHDASAVSVVPFGSIAAANVQDALEEIVAEASGSGGPGGFDVTPPGSNAMPPWVKPTGTGVITADPQGRLTIDAGSGYKAFPSMTFLEGRLYLVYRDGTGHVSAGGVVKLRTSNDLGRTWSSATTIATPAGSDDNRDPIIGALSSGRLLLYYFRSTSGGSVAVDLRVRYSDDRGQTWTSEYTVPDTFSGELAGSGSITELPSGDILISGYGESGGNWEAVTYRSTDDGETFGDETIVASSGSRDFYEPVLRYLSTGKLVAMLRTDGTAHHYRAVSSDLGQTWALATDVLTAGESRPDFVEFYPDALIMFVRMASGDADAGWTVSWDGGATWTAMQEMDAGETRDSMYSAPVTLAPGYVAVAYALETSSTDTDLYLRYFYDGYGTDPIGQLRASGLFLNGVEFDDTDPDDGEVWTYDSGTGKYVLDTPAATVTAATLAAHGAVGELVIQDIPAGAPLVFGDIVQNEAQDELVYADLYD